MLYNVRYASNALNKFTSKLSNTNTLSFCVLTVHYACISEDLIFRISYYQGFRLAT